MLARALLDVFHLPDSMNINSPDVAVKIFKPMSQPVTG